jgi:hypothetical protein
MRQSPTGLRLVRCLTIAALMLAIGSAPACTGSDVPGGAFGPGDAGDPTDPSGELDPLDPSGSPPPAPEAGRIKAKTYTSGSPIDGPIWVVSVDHSPGVPIGINSSVVVDGVRPGDRLVSLDGVAANCHLIKGENPRELTVVSGLAAQTEFHLACDDPSSARVTTR